MTEDDWSVSECDQSGDTDDAPTLLLIVLSSTKQQNRDLVSSLQSSLCSPIYFV